jgi:hypothetical protein
LPSVINFSASLCASFALGHDVEIDSCSMRDVTRLRRSALRWAESLLKWRYLVRPPAIVAAGGGGLLSRVVPRISVACEESEMQSNCLRVVSGEGLLVYRRGCMNSTPSQGMDIWVKPKPNSSLFESPRQSRLGRLRPIPTDDTSTSPNSSLTSKVSQSLQSSQIIMGFTSGLVRTLLSNTIAILQAELTPFSSAASPSQQQSYTSR